MTKQMQETLFQPIPAYTACVLGGVNAGRVVTVTGISRANSMLVFCEQGAADDWGPTWSVERVIQLQRV